MPPRFTYWTIIFEGKPTAFRARDREELTPTLRQLQARHPDARLMWFARGRLWESPEQEREALRRKRGTVRETRGSDWRPGGKHQDPRERFKVPRAEKRRRFAERTRRDRRTDQEGGDGPRQPHHRERGARRFEGNRQQGSVRRESRSFAPRPAGRRHPGRRGGRGGGSSR